MSGTLLVRMSPADYLSAATKNQVFLYSDGHLLFDQFNHIDKEEQGMPQEYSFRHQISPTLVTKEFLKLVPSLKLYDLLSCSGASDGY